MTARLAFARVAPALFHARAAPSLVARRAALVRGYASPSEHSVSLYARNKEIQFPDLQAIDDSS
jgi:hypothetical protein